MSDPRELKFEILPIDFDVRPRTPEERLMSAVLEEAVTTFERGLHSHDPMVRQAAMEVDQWVRSRESDELFSFESVCGNLGLSAGYVRAGLAAMKLLARTASRTEPVRKRYRVRVTERRHWRGRIRSNG
jgi:hypothetical protein